jgi:predicted Zn-dependent protease
MLHYNSRVRTIGLQAALRFGDAGRVLGEFDKLLKASPGEPYLNNSRGEVCLWLGRYAEAERCLRRELSANPELPWSRVGLCGVRAMRGDYKGALAQLDDARRLTGAAEAALAPWRGEVYRRQGRPADALAELAKANARMPFRPSLWLNDALARGDLGDRAGQRRILEKLARHAPEFLADAATEARCRWRPGARASDGEARRVLEKGLALMRGNRSSWMYTYVLGSGKIKLIRLSGVPASKIPQGYAGFRWMFA